MRKAVFLDRDGLINEKAREHDYVKSWPEFRFLPGAIDAVRRLNDADYLVFVVTNQRGVARGLMRMEDVSDIHEKMQKAFLDGGAKIDRIYTCPHEKGTCRCRKPDIGLFLQAERDYGIDRNESWMVGDSESDTEAGRRFGLKTIMTVSLQEAAEIILKG